MPATATITSFFSFTPNTTALSGSVNTNFSNFRGHLIPIETATATASDNTYDLGSTGYRYANSYVAQNSYYGTPGTTGGWRVRVGTATTSFIFDRYSSTAWVQKFDAASNFTGQTSTTVTLTSEFTAGELDIVKVGDLVSVQLSVGATSANTTSANMTTALPSWARPPATVFSGVLATGLVARYRIDADGDFSVIYIDWAGALVANTGGFSGATFSYKAS